MGLTLNLDIRVRRKVFVPARNQTPAIQSIAIILVIQQSWIIFIDKIMRWN